MNQYLFQATIRKNGKPKRKSIPTEERIWGRTELRARRHLLNKIYENGWLVTKVNSVSLVAKDTR
jgi:hypothetical protein